jgi:hypothetical protein
VSLPIGAQLRPSGGQARIQHDEELMCQLLGIIALQPRVQVLSRDFVIAPSSSAEKAADRSARCATAQTVLDSGGLIARWLRGRIGLASRSTRR